MKKALVLIAAVVLFAVAATAQNATFEGFLQQFPKASLPFSLGEQDLRNQLETRAANLPVAKATRLGWEYYGFLPSLEENARESRMPVYPEPVAMLETADNYAVIYNTGRSFARQYKTYNVAIFDKKGNFISSRCIGGVNPTTLASATINENLEITVKEYSVNWEKNYSTNGIEGNVINSITPISTYIFGGSVDATGSYNWQNAPVEVLESKVASK